MREKKKVIVRKKIFAVVTRETVWSFLQMAKTVDKTCEVLSSDPKESFVRFIEPVESGNGPKRYGWIDNDALREIDAAR